MFTVFIVSMLALMQLCMPPPLYKTGNTPNILLVYTRKMRVKRSLHLLIAAAILFSQIVTGIHMAGHMQGPAVAFAAPAAAPPMMASLHESRSVHLTTGNHEALHQQQLHITTSSDSDKGQSSHELSCVIYHIYAGSHCLAENPVVSIAGSFLVSLQQISFSSEPLRSLPEHNAIRGPPEFS